MPSRDISIRRFCANIVDPEQTHACCEFSFYRHFFHKFSFFSINQPVQGSPSKNEGEGRQINVVVFSFLDNVFINLKCKYY